MTDLLRMDYINSLPQPFLARFCGDKDTWWPVHCFGVDAAVCLIDVLRNTCRFCKSTNWKAPRTAQGEPR